MTKLTPLAVMRQRLAATAAPVTGTVDAVLEGEWHPLEESTIVSRLPYKGFVAQTRKECFQKINRKS